MWDVVVEPSARTCCHPNLLANLFFKFHYELACNVNSKRCPTKLIRLHAYNTRAFGHIFAPLWEISEHKSQILQLAEISLSATCPYIAHVSAKPTGAPFLGRRRRVLHTPNVKLRPCAEPDLRIASLWDRRCGVG